MERAVECVGDACILLIVRDLLSGPKRFCELEELTGTNTRTLTSKLKKLQDEGIVSRKEFNEKPPRVEYTLTKKGRALAPIEKALRAYGAKYL